MCIYICIYIQVIYILVISRSAYIHSVYGTDWTKRFSKHKKTYVEHVHTNYLYLPISAAPNMHSHHHFLCKAGHLLKTANVLTLKQGNSP